MARRWTDEDEMDWAENVARIRTEKDMKDFFDWCINVSLMAVGLYAVIQIFKTMCDSPWILPVGF